MFWGYTVLDIVIGIRDVSIHDVEYLLKKQQKKDESSTERALTYWQYMIDNRTANDKTSLFDYFSFISEDGAKKCKVANNSDLDWIWHWIILF